LKKIEVKKIKEQDIVIPGSKSISHRMMICASLCNGTSNIKNVLQSDDILLTIKALKNMGAKIDPVLEDHHKVTGFNGNPAPYNKKIYLGNSGTSMRLLAGIAALGKKEYTLTGDQRMCERPMNELLDALTMLNIFAKSDNKNGTPPVHIRGDSKKGGSSCGGLFLCPSRGGRSVRRPWPRVD